jgi:predicted NUDIX family NTP pyrophosphohydrolase
MASFSAGILMHQHKDRDLYVLLVHPGGPIWRHRDLGAWSIPKGEPEPGETAEDAARREFGEELGSVPAAPLVHLGRIQQRGGKSVEAFALDGDFDVASYRCGSWFEIEWPPRSGRLQSFPEIDQAAWFPLSEAYQKILSGQRPLLDRLQEISALARPT